MAITEGQLQVHGVTTCMARFSEFQNHWNRKTTGLQDTQFISMPACYFCYQWSQLHLRLQVNDKVKPSVQYFLTTHLLVEKIPHPLKLNCFPATSKVSKALPLTRLDTWLHAWCCSKWVSVSIWRLSECPHPHYKVAAGWSFHCVHVGTGIIIISGVQMWWFPQCTLVSRFFRGVSLQGYSVIARHHGIFNSQYPESTRSTDCFTTSVDHTCTLYNAGLFPILICGHFCHQFNNAPIIGHPLGFY